MAMRPARPAPGQHSLAPAREHQQSEAADSRSPFLQIDQANATVTADNKMKIYGQVSPTLTATVVGQVVGGDTINYSLSTTAMQFSNVGPYVITVTLGSNPNYNVTPANGTLTINQATASVFKVGSTVPVKFSAPCDANGNPISDPMAVFGTTTGTITLLNTVRGTVDNVNEQPISDIPDVAFRYSSGIWIFNMATNNLTKNTTYYYRIPFATGGYIYFNFGTK